jgi:hypothetical protein
VVFSSNDGGRLTIMRNMLATAILVASVAPVIAGEDVTLTPGALTV